MAATHDDAAHMRRSLDDRIRSYADTTGMPHDRIRKLIMFQRLAARFAEIDDGRLILKGGVTLLWRVGEETRATKDVDANWVGTVDCLDAFLDAVTGIDMGDWFVFEIGRPSRVEGETFAAFRYGVKALLDGREFGRFRLDINLADSIDGRELLEVDTPILDAYGLAQVSVWAISLEQQLAEKLHATVRAYGKSSSSRVKDAFDIVVLAQSVPVPPIDVLRAAVRHTFATRETTLPVEPPSIPTAWNAELNGLLAGFSVEGVPDAEELAATWVAFWGPVLESPSEMTRWDPTSRRWR